MLHSFRSFPEKVSKAKAHLLERQSEYRHMMRIRIRN
jgi:hypothetical protein